MRVLFVCSGNSDFGISPILRNQSDSLIRKGIDIEYFLIKEKGIPGYLKYIRILKKYLSENEFDVVHAHYIFSAFVASLAGAKPLVVSLMGSDINLSKHLRTLARIFHTYSWKKLIVKSQEMKELLKIKEAIVVPNGVNFNRFRSIAKEEALTFTGWDRNKTNILFAANPVKGVKNYALAKQAINMIDNDSIEIKALENIDNSDIPYYMNSADVVLLTSLWEGSPNVVKEAMACGRPIVSTDVGDVKELLKDTSGCYVVDHDPENVSRAIASALEFKGITNGRQEIADLREENIADRLISIYNSVKI